MKTKGFQMAKKKLRGLGKVLTLSALLAFLSSACHKDPQPQPDPEPTPTDTVQPIIPTKEIVIDWNWEDGIALAPPKDTIKYYTDQDSVKYVFINLISTAVNAPWSTGYRPKEFHKARDTLQTRLDIDLNKVRGSGTVFVNSQNGAQLPPNYGYESVPGMSLEDSIWYTANGWKVERFNGKEY